MKNPDKKKKLMYGVLGGALVVSGLLVGKSGVIQVIGLSNQGKKTDASSNPVKPIADDMVKPKAEVKTSAPANKNISDNNERSSTLSFNSNSSKKSDSSFDTIMKSTASVGDSGRTSKPLSVQPASKPNIINSKGNNIISANKNVAVTNMGAKVTGKVDANVLEANKKRRDILNGQILAKENEHKKLIKASDWHAGLPLRNEIAMLKAQLHYV